MDALLAGLLEWASHLLTTREGQILLAVLLGMGPIFALTWKYGDKLIETRRAREEREAAERKAREEAEGQSLSELKEQAKAAANSLIVALNDRIDTLEQSHEQCTSDNRKLIAHVSRCDAELAATQTRVMLLEQQDRTTQDKLEALMSGIQYLRESVHDQTS